MAIVLFVLSAIVAYTGISYFGQLSGEVKGGALAAFFSTVRPLPLLVVTLANMFFGLALYYGFSITRYAIPATISIGVITSFVYSVLFLGASVTVTKLVGVALVILGIVALST